MTKAEYIEKYGIERYEVWKAKTGEYHKERYRNDPEFREVRNTKNREHHKECYHNDPEYRLNRRLRRKRSYCRPGEFELIENYELAKADNFSGWDVHHRLELTLDGEFAHSPEDLKRMNMYYNRPYFELIFIRHGEHRKLHMNFNRTQIEEINAQ